MQVGYRKRKWYSQDKQEEEIVCTEEEKAMWRKESETGTGSVNEKRKWYRQRYKMQVGYRKEKQEQEVVRTKKE